VITAIPFEWPPPKRAWIPRLGSSAALWYAGILKESTKMTIRLPKELESSIEAAVQYGQFASVDDAMTEAARLLLGHLKQPSPPTHADVAASPDPVLGSIGALKEDADLLDKIVADAYRRRTEPWRKIDRRGSPAL
jgi:Arc/MetJ-type ribon-helix-helix transcriptional regulator